MFLAKFNVIHIKTFLKTKPIMVLLIGLTLLSVIFRIWVSTPSWMHYDENYYINIAQNYQDRGELTPYMWRLGDINIISGGGSGYGIILLTNWLIITGMSLFWGRILMVAAGILSSIIMYKTAALWWNSRTAGWSAFVYALVSTSSFYTLILKMDALATLVYSLILLLHITAIKTGKKIFHFLSGIFAVFTFEFHVIGIIYLLAISIYYGYQLIIHISTKKSLISCTSPFYFGAGAFLAGIAYAFIHVIPDPQAYFLISNECFECNENILTTEFKRLVRLMVFRPHEIIFFFFIVIAALKRFKLNDLHYLLIIVGWLFGQAIFSLPPYDHYTNHMWPLLALGAGGFIAKGLNNLESRNREWLWLCIALIVLFGNLVLHLQGNHPSLLSSNLSKQRQVDYILKNIDKDVVIMGKVPSFYPLQDYRNFVTYLDGTVYGMKYRQENPLDFWDQVKPEIIFLTEEVVVRDDDLKRYMSDHRMIKVMESLWITDRLLNNISGD